MRVAYLMLLSIAASLAGTTAGAPKKASERLDHIERWMQAIDVQIMALGIDGFSPSFTSEYVSTRSRDGSIAAQKRRFRARLGLAIAESLPEAEHLTVHPDGHIDEEAARAVVAELRERGFEVHWLAHGPAGPYAFVGLPGPKKVQGPAPGVDTTININDD